MQICEFIDHYTNAILPGACETLHTINVVYKFLWDTRNVGFCLVSRITLIKLKILFIDLCSYKLT